MNMNNFHLLDQGFYREHLEKYEEQNTDFHLLMTLLHLTSL